MKKVINKHILIVEMELLKNEFIEDSYQTRLNVIKEMSYEQYKKIIEAVNLIQKLEQHFKEDES